MQLKIGELAGGALNELLEYELEKVFENIADPNTSKKPRTVNVKLIFTPDEQFVNEVKLSFQVQSKLIPAEEIKTKIIFGQNSGGGFEAEELFKGQMPGQVKIEETKVVKMSK